MCISSNSLKDLERGTRTLKVIQVVVSCQLLAVQKQLQRFVNWWPDTHVWPLFLLENQLNFNQKIVHHIRLKILERGRSA